VADHPQPVTQNLDVVWLEFGFGDTTNRKMAVHYYECVAAHANVEEMNNLGACFDFGK
jgi:TPR repeat protein